MQKIHISISRQRLRFFVGGKLRKNCAVSTSKFGEGTEPGSFKTPTGRFRIAQKIGDGAALGEVFKSRIPQGRVGREDEEDDLVQTRILWLDGLDEENKNTHERYIYIHGTNHESQIGTKASHGCIRMRNEEVAALYDLVKEGAEVFIQP